MCVTEQYVISGFTRCQGQGDIWHLLPEHVFARVSKPVRESSSRLWAQLREG